MVLLLLWLLTSCASSPPQDVIRQNVSSGKYEAALNTLEQSDLKKIDRHQFLYLLEKGQIYFTKGEEKLALDTWQNARELLKGFYKKTAKDKIQTSFSNNNYQVFQGEVFEQHQLFFHISLAYLRLAQKIITEPRERIQYLSFAKAALLDWDSFIKGLERNGVKKFYKESFLARFYAAHIHEMMKSSEDYQIAYQLMKDAKSLKEKMNSAGSLPIVGDINELIGEALIRLSQKSGRRSETAKWEREFQIKRSSVDMNPVIVLLNTGLIAQKKPDHIPFSLNYALNNPTSDVKGNLLGIGLGVMNSFSMNVLRLGYTGHHSHQYGYIGFQYDLAGSSAIIFEMPVRENLRPSEGVNSAAIEFKNETSPEDSVSTMASNLISLSNLSRISLAKDFNELYFKTGLRVAMKYLAAIIGSYQVYRSFMNQNHNPQNQSSPMAGFAASTSFALSAAAIRAGERADVRYWSTLPDKIFSSLTSLNDGDYTVNYSGVKIGEIHRKSQDLEVFSFSLPYLQ